jgi:hypothetical protein
MAGSGLALSTAGRKRDVARAGFKVVDKETNVIAKSTMSRSLVLTVMLFGSASAVHAQSLQTSEPLPPSPWSAPALHISLTTAFVGLQALDVATTLRGVKNGSAVEANPLMAGLANRPMALVAVKSALTAATVASVHGLSRKHPKGAVLALIALNVGSAFVVRSNFRMTSTR